MSGHSKWATIHRKKGLIDAERGKIFQKLAKEIAVAAKGTNGDPDMNPGLRMVIEKARSNNMPKDNIEKAINKAIGNAGDVNYDSIRYEGYAPHGIALMVDCLTDNKNRTAMLVRSTLTKHGGNLGTDGSVSYMFKRLGVIEIESPLGQKIKVYDLERTICDIVKYKNKIDPEIFSKALKKYANSKTKKLNNLIYYARILKVEDEVRKYMEVLL